MNKPTRAGPIGLCSGLLLLCAMFFLGPLSAWAADCEFVLGFATLKALIDEVEGPDKVGQCLESEHFNPENGDSLQQTTGGLLVWRKADNWTAFTDGYRTWINGPSGLQMRLNTEHFDWEAPAALTLDVLKNTEYQSEFPASGKAKLTDGTYFEPYEPGSASGVHLTLMSEHLALGDLNSDGVDDAVVILEASGGGSGTFRYLTAVLNEGGQPRHVASALLGDRVHIESLAIQAGRIVVQMIAHGPGDGQCCPTQKQTHTFRLAGDTLEPVPLTLELLKNAEYQSEFPASGKAKLTDGTFFEPYEPGSASGVNIALSDVVFGNLNGDGVADAAVVLIADPGGSGTFRHLAAVVNEGGQPRHVTSALLGDRVKIESLAIEAGLIVVGMIAHGPDDPLCCPTQKMSRAFRLAGDTLKMATPIVDVQWHWERFEDTRSRSWDIIVADPHNYTLRLLPGGTFQVKADCNAGNGAYTAAGSSITLTLGPVTRAACPPESLSKSYLSLLGDVVTYVLHEGKLFLNLKIDSGNMVFINTEPAPQS